MSKRSSPTPSIKSSSVGGRGLFADDAVHYIPGDLIATYKPLVYSVTPAMAKACCHWCLTTDASKYYQCSGCRYAVYCSKECAKAAYKLGTHKRECQLIKKLPADHASSAPLTTFLAAAKLHWLAEEDETVQGSLDEMCRHADANDTLEADSGSTAILLSRYLNDSPPVPVMLDLLRVLRYNAVTITNDSLQDVALGFYREVSAMNHSCSPNVVLTFSGSTVTLRAIRSIPQGGELFISYVDVCITPTSKRRQRLHDQYKFDCSCERCSRKDKSYPKLVYAEEDLRLSVQKQDWKEAARAGRLVDELRVSLSGGQEYDVCLGVNAYMLAKILSLDDGLLREALTYFAKAYRILSITHGSGHPMVEEIKGKMIELRNYVHQLAARPSSRHPVVSAVRYVHPVPERRVEHIKEDGQEEESAPTPGGERIDYKILKTVNGRYPVYKRFMKSGREVNTIVRHVRGDINQCRRHLSEICEAPVRLHIGSLEVRGIHTWKIVEFFRSINMDEMKHKSMEEITMGQYGYVPRLATQSPEPRPITTLWSIQYFHPDDLVAECLISEKKSTDKEGEGDGKTASKKEYKPTVHLLLIRHGQYNLDSDENELTELGKEQSRIVGQRLKQMTDGMKSDRYGTRKIKFKKLISSDVLRAKQTAEIIHEVLGGEEAVHYEDPDPILGRGLAVRAHADSYSKIRPARLLEEGNRLEAAYRKTGGPETLADVGPAKEAVGEDGDDEEDLTKGHEYYIVVCHMNVIRYFVCRALQLPPEAWLRMGGENCGITEIIVRDDGGVSLARFGDNGHLTIEQSTFH
ncbi:SET and MYND domain-containing protein 3 [Perkinsus olseni]|uniref:SET and MYND domain-containing protein 3 n=1 Tax=Perkinsus olseni TaxID=32597 RepID=A0A7J6PIF9_PEROL|nr:SET and MYND domain-containing protein 3 [Perkinsus olseni]